MTSQDSKKSSTSTLNQKLQEESETELLDHPSYEDLQKKTTEAEEKASQYWERLLRLQADMDNLQRRAERDVAGAHKYALEKFLLELLPIIDGLERAVIAHANETAGPDSLLDGVQLTLKMLYAALEKFGVQSLDPLGEPFNSEHHQAISTQEDPKVKAGSVMNVLQKGYLLNNRLIRPALVVVAK